MNDLYNKAIEFAAKENGAVKASVFLRGMCAKTDSKLDAIERIAPMGMTAEYAYAVDKAAEKVAQLLHALLYTSVKSWEFVNRKETD